MTRAQQTVFSNMPMSSDKDKAGRGGGGMKRNTMHLQYAQGNAPVKSQVLIYLQDAFSIEHLSF